MPTSSRKQLGRHEEPDHPAWSPCWLAGDTARPGGAAGAGLFPGDLAGAAGTPSNLGKVGDACESFYILSSNNTSAKSSVALADVDPLGVNHNISFDDVGGLEERKFKNRSPSRPLSYIVHQTSANSRR